MNRINILGGWRPPGVCVNGATSWRQTPDLVFGGHIYRAARVARGIELSARPIRLGAMEVSWGKWVMRVIRAWDNEKSPLGRELGVFGVSDSPDKT